MTKILIHKKLSGVKHISSEDCPCNPQSASAITVGGVLNVY